MILNILSAFVSKWKIIIAVIAILSMISFCYVMDQRYRNVMYDLEKANRLKERLEVQLKNEQSKTTSLSLELALKKNEVGNMSQLLSDCQRNNLSATKELQQIDDLTKQIIIDIDKKPETNTSAESIIIGRINAQQKKDIIQLFNKQFDTTN